MELARLGASCVEKTGRPEVKEALSWKKDGLFRICWVLLVVAAVTRPDSADDERFRPAADR